MSWHSLDKLHASDDMQVMTCNYTIYITICMLLSDITDILHYGTGLRCFQ